MPFLANLVNNSVADRDECLYCQKIVSLGKSLRNYSTDELYTGDIPNAEQMAYSSLIFLNKNFSWIFSEFFPHSFG